MEKNLSEVTFDFFENLFGLAGEISLTILNRVYRYIKFVLKWTGVGLALSAIVGATGAYFDRAGVVFLGIAGVGISITFALLALSPALYLLWVAREKDEKIDRITKTVFVIMAGILILGVYVAIFHAWQSPEFWILLVAVGILIMTTVMTGSSISPEAIGGWAKRVSIIVVVLMAVSYGIQQLPDYFQARFTDRAKLTIGLDSDEVAYESIDKFFSSDGKPAIWYTENNGQRKFFKAPGYDKRTGDSRIAITKQIVEEEDSQRVLEKKVAEQKLIDEKKAVDEQKVVVDAQTAKLKADKEQKDEIARQQRQEGENLVRERAESERIARETAQEEQRQLALQPISLTTTILESTDKSQDIVLVRPSEQFVYRGQAIRPDQSVVVLDITEVKETSDKNQYELTLHPQTIMSGGRSYPIGRQTESIRLTVRKDNSRSILKILAGAGAGAVIGGFTGGKKGAAAGAVIGGAAGTIYAVASHGKKFNLTIGDAVPPIVIRPAL